MGMTPPAARAGFQTSSLKNVGAQRVAVRRRQDERESPLFPLRLRATPRQLDLDGRILQEVRRQLGSDEAGHIDDARLPGLGQGEVQTAVE
ncbi:hypothetical protein [Streptomyces sp. NPDC005865]|uniref:hypothetical protein n=1 Tax=Streptomyces sp. NPDC005865 TaxID=3155453 RepID=UPI0033D3829E